MSGYLESPSPIAFAHRGGAWEGIENSFEAIQRCVELGYHYVETDVHLTKDGEVVAVHDASLDRTTDRRGRIRDLTWREVSKARIGGTAHIPRLVDLFEEFPDLRFNIDAKVSDVVVPLIQLIEAGGPKVAERVCLASFSDARLRRMRTLTRGMVATSMGQSEITRLRMASFMRTSLKALRFPGGAAQVPMTFRGRRIVDLRFVETAHQIGKKVHVWTVDDAADMRELLDLGVDGIISDQPETLKRVLQQRGQWHE